MTETHLAEHVHRRAGHLIDGAGIVGRFTREEGVGGDHRSVAEVERGIVLAGGHAEGFHGKSPGERGNRVGAGLANADIAAGGR